MFRTWRIALALPAVVAALLWTSGPLLARGPGGGGHGGGGFHGGGGHVAAFHGGGYGGGFHGGYGGGWHGGYGGYGHGGYGHGGYGGYGRGWYGGYGRGYGWNRGGWGWGGYYGGFPYYYGGYYGAYPYSGSYYGSYPYYYGTGYLPSYWQSYNSSTVTPYVATPDYSSGSLYSSATQPSVPMTENQSPTTTDTIAHVDVKVPASAQVWVEGAKTSQTGALRHFVSPPLTPNEDFTYDIRARWTDQKGDVVDQTRHVLVHAGGQVVVNFTEPATAASE
jgi:uncharacterized protein (TIGR03000 family)